MKVETIQGVKVVCQSVKTVGNMQMDVYFYMIDGGSSKIRSVLQYD